MSNVGCMRCESAIQIKTCKHCKHITANQSHCENCGRGLFDCVKLNRTIAPAPETSVVPPPPPTVQPRNRREATVSRFSKIRPTYEDYKDLESNDIRIYNRIYEKLNEGLMKIRNHETQTKHQLSVLAGYLNHMFLYGHTNVAMGNPDIGEAIITEYPVEIQYLIERCAIKKTPTHAAFFEGHGLSNSKTKVKPNNPNINGVLNMVDVIQPQAPITDNDYIYTPRGRQILDRINEIRDEYRSLDTPRNRYESSIQSKLTDLIIERNTLYGQLKYERWLPGEQPPMQLEEVLPPPPPEAPQLKKIKFTVKKNKK